IEEPSRTVWILPRINRNRGYRWNRPSVGFGTFRRMHPFRELLLEFTKDTRVRPENSLLTIKNGSECRIGFERRAARPCLGGCAAQRGVDQPDGSIENP